MVFAFHIKKKDLRDLVNVFVFPFWWIKLELDKKRQFLKFKQD